MRYIGIIILLVLCLTLLLFTGCKINTVKPEPASGDLENQENINQSSNNSQSSSTGPVYETVIVDTEDPEMIYPQKWATGTGTASNPWANDCIKKAYDACPTGGTIFLKTGYYQLDTVLGIGKTINLIGEGMQKTFIVLNMTAANGIYVQADYVTLKGFTIDGDSQDDNGWSLINIQASNYALFEDLEIMNAGLLGMNIFEDNYSTFRNIHAHDNYSHGLHPGSNTTGRGIYNTYQDIYAWNNGRLGFSDRGNGESGNPIEQTGNVYDNLQCWDNNETGIEIDYQKGIVLSNSFASGNGYRGINLVGIEDSNINSCVSTLNGAPGELPGTVLNNCKNVNLTNVIVLNNYTGIHLGDCSDITLTSCQSYDDRDTLLQRFGLQLTGTNTEISLLNCKISPNAFGDIYNPNGVVVKIITEKMLAKF